MRVLRLERATPLSAVLSLSWLCVPCPCCFYFRQMCLGPPADGRERVDQRRAKFGQRVLHLKIIRTSSILRKEVSVHVTTIWNSSAAWGSDQVFLVLPLNFVLMAMTFLKWL